MKISFIGTGTMATAMIKSIIDAGIFVPQDIMGSFHREKKAQEVKETLHINTTTSNTEA
ncbi:MAG: pyrroline-5-carboxylate reductase, partial [Caldisericum exile]